MTRRARIGMLAAVCITSVLLVAAQKTKETEERKVPEIPGITTADKIPNGCVGCHKNRPEKNKDHRLTTTLRKWREGAAPMRLEMAQAAMPSGVKLTGKHPDVQALVKVIPDDCLMCHWKGARTVPPFGKLLHSIHLTGGTENHFVTGAGGQCTHPP